MMKKEEQERKKERKRDICIMDGLVSKREQCRETEKRVM